MAKLTEKARLLAHRLPPSGPFGRGVPAAAARKRNPGFVPAKAVGTFVPRLTQKSFEKFGFSAATLLTDWATIVGPALARDTRPERLKWPRPPGMAADSGDDGAECFAGRPGATLVLKVDPARALDVEYKRAQILERINGYFGYRALAEIRIVQEPVAHAARPHGAAHGAVHGAVRAAALPSAPTPSVPPPDMTSVSDAGLRAALERLHAGVSRRATGG